MFTPSNMLHRYLNVRPRDMYDVAGALMGYINADPAFRTNDFEEAIKYVLSHGVSEVELYKEFNPDYDFEEDESKWDSEYYSYARVYLKKNFCRKRIEHVKKVAGKLYPPTDSSMPVRKPVPQKEETESAKKQTAVPQKEETRFTKTQTVQIQGGQQKTGKKSRSQSGRRKVIRALIIAGIALLVILLVIIGVRLALGIVSIIR